MSQEPIGFKWYWGALMRSTLLLFMLFATSSLFAATTGKSDIGATPAQTNLKGTVYASLTTIENVDYPTPIIAPTMEFYPQNPVTPKVYYTGRNSTTYSKSEVAPTVPGEYTAYVDLETIDLDHWKVDTLQNLKSVQNFSIMTPDLTIIATTQPIEAYNYTGKAVTNVIAQANTQVIPGRWDIEDSATLLTVGDHVKLLTFTADDPHYGQKDSLLNVSIIPANLYLVAATAKNIIYEDPLSSATISAQFETHTDSIVTLTSADGITIYNNVTDVAPNNFYPVVDQGSTTYAWSFDPAEDSFFTYNSIINEQVPIQVARKSLIFDSDIKFTNLDRFYYDIEVAGVQISRTFNSNLVICDSEITYWNGDAQMNFSDLQNWDAQTYTVKAAPLLIQGQNYTFNEKTVDYKVNPRAIANIFVDTFKIFAEDDILTNTVKTFIAYDVKDEHLAVESLKYTYGGLMTNPNHTDSMETDTYHKLNIEFISSNKNYATLDTYISVFRFKDPVPFTWIGVAPITYPDTLGLATISFSGEDVSSVEFVNKNVVYDVITTRNSDDFNPMLDGRHKWIAKSKFPYYSDSEYWSFVTINQAIMPAHLNKNDTTQTWGIITIPKLTYEQNWYKPENTRDTAPYTIKFYNDGQLKNEISHENIIKNTNVGDYYITANPVLDSSNYTINKIVDKFRIEQQKPAVVVATRTLPVGLTLAKAIVNYTGKVKRQGADSVFYGEFVVLNDDPTTASDVGQTKDVYYTLTPYDKNIATYSSSVRINIVSSTFNPSNIASSPITYGQKLAATQLTMDNLDFATIQWDKPDVIPVVSESATKSFAYTIKVIYDPSQEIRGTKTIEVNPLNLTSNNVIISNPVNPIYDGNTKEPQITYVGLPAGSLTPTKPNFAYEIGNIEPGIRKVKLDYRTNHSGSITGTFEILPDPLLVENVSDTIKIYNGDYQYATVHATSTGVTPATVDTVIYQLAGERSWIDSPILAGQYNMKSVFSQAGASWTRLDSFIIERRPLSAENFVVSNTTTTFDSGLDVKVEFVGLYPVPADTEYMLTYNEGSTQIPTSIGVHPVKVNMIANYSGIYQTTAIIKPTPPPEMPPEIPTTPGNPPEIPLTIKEGQVGFIDLPSGKNNASEDVKLALFSKIENQDESTNPADAPIIIKITMNDDPLFDGELFFKGAKLKKEANNTYIISLKYKESQWLSLRANPKSAFLGTKKISLRMTVASTDRTVRISGGTRSATIEYISNLIVIDEPVRFSINTVLNKKHPDPQSLNLLSFINETNRDGIKIYLDDIFTSKHATISLESDSSIKYDYSTMDQASIDALRTVGLEDTFTCKLTRNNAVTIVNVNVFTAHEHALGTTLVVRAEELDLPIFEKTPSSKGEYIRPYEKLKPGKVAKVRKLSIKTKRNVDNKDVTLTIAGTVSLRNKKLFATANKTDFTQNIIAKDTAMTYQKKSLAVTVRLKAKQKYGSVDTEVHFVNIVPPTFAKTDRIFGVEYLDPKNFKITKYLYFEVQHSGSKPKVWGEYIDIKKRLKKVSFSIVKKDINVTSAEGAPIQITKTITPGENGKLIIKHHKILDQNVGRLDLVIDNKNGVAGRTIPTVK